MEHDSRVADRDENYVGFHRHLRPLAVALWDDGVHEMRTWVPAEVRAWHRRPDGTWDANLMVTPAPGENRLVVMHQDLVQEIPDHEDLEYLSPGDYRR